MAKSLFKKIFFSTAFGVLVGLAFFLRKKLLAALIGYIFLCISWFFGHQLSFEAIRYDQGSFYVQKPRLLEEEREIFKAHLVKIDVHALSSALSSMISLELDTPEFSLDNIPKKAAFSTDLFETVFKKTRLIRHIHGTKGSLVYQEQRYPFSFKVTSDQLLVSAQVSIPSMPAAVFSKYLMIHEPLRSYTLASGSVEGTILLSFSRQGELFYLDSSIKGERVVVEKAQEKLKACLGEVAITACFQKQEGKHVYIQELDLKNKLEQITPSLTIKDSSIFISDLAGKLLWKAEDINFFASLAHHGIPEVAASGHILKGARALPFSFQGKGVFEGFNSWDLDLENSAEIPLDLKRCKRIGIKKKGPQEFIIALDVDGIDELDVHMLKELFDPMLRTYDAYQFHKGKIKADLLCHLKNGSIEYIECKDLVVKEALLEDKQEGISVKIPSLKAAAWIQAPFSSLARLHNWELHFTQLEIHHPKYSKELSLEGQVFCEKGEYLSTIIKVGYMGACAICESHGTIEKQDIKMQMILGSQLLSSIQQKVCQRSKDIEALEKVFFDMTCVKGSQGYHIQGSSLMEFDKGCQDEILFQFTTDVVSLCKEFSLDKLLASKVYFSSKKVSASTYLLFLEPFALKWFVLGDMQVKGSIDAAGLDFETWAEKALYDSEDILVDLPKKQQLHYGKFHFDRAKKAWDIFLPIRQARCQDKKLHLPFEHVDTDITIQGTDLFAKNLKAFCENVLFSGLIHIDFKDPNWVDLKLYPSSMEGEVSCFLAFLAHIVDPKLVAFFSSAQGTIHGGSNNYFAIKYNLTQIEKKAHVEIEAQDVSCALSTKCCLSQGAFCLVWDIEKNFLEIKDFSSKLLVEENEGEKIYELRLAELSCKDLTNLVLDVDVRLETSLLDLARLSGKVVYDQELIQVQLQGDHNHVFGAKIHDMDLSLTPDLCLNHIKTGLIFSDQQLSACIDFLKKIDVLDAKFDCILDSCYSPRFSKACLSVEKKPEQSQCKLLLSADDLSMISLRPERCEVMIAWLCDQVSAQISYGDFQAFCLAEKKEDIWSLHVLEAKSLYGFIRSTQGTLTAQTLALDFASLAFDLQGLTPFFQDPMHLDLLDQRSLLGSLELKIQLPSSVKPLFVEGVFTGASQSKIDQDLSCKTSQPLIFTYSLEQGLEIQQLQLQLFLQNKQQVFSSICCEKAFFKGKENFGIKGAKLSINPELLHYFVKHYPTKAISSNGEKIRISKAEFIWDNHLETQLDFLADGQALQIQGVLKEGYYWIGKESVYLQKIYYFLDQGHFNVVFGLDYEELSVDVLAKLQFKETQELQLSIKPFHQDASADERTSLEILCKADDQEGFSIQSIEGELFGVECSLRKNPRAYAPHILLLTGHLKCHPSKVATFFKKKSLAFLKDLGSGYELSGDFFLCSRDLFSSYFRGYFKGRDFHFQNFYFKTLMSEVDLKFHQLHIHDLCLSDLSGMLKVKEIKIFKEEDASWKMKIPEVVLQDFRPSFLRKSMTQEEKIKPLVIKNLHMFNIEGTLFQPETFKGRGYLDFINTFKREMHILDIPIEIIGRIGFDLGIFIPVVGKLEFEMHQGKIVLKELKNTFSEGKRSRFYLSGYKDSYIGLDGQLAIDIKMKQYVLLKFTEPFTLSIRGTVFKPRYSLH